MRVFEYQLVSAGNLASNITSAAQQLNQMLMCSIQAVWSGSSPSGTLKLQISNDDSNWTDYSGSSQSVSGNTGSIMWNMSATPFPWIRVVYTAVSGTGSLNVTVNGKGPG